MATLSFERVDKTVTVLAPDTSVTVQELVDAIADYADEPAYLDLDMMATWDGKADLGGGEFTGITLTMINDWRIQFEARGGPTYESCQVSGGNLVAVNSYGNNPIKPTAYTQVQIRQSQAPTLLVGVDNPVTVGLIQTDVVDAVALSADAVAEIVAGIFSKVIAAPTGAPALGTADFEELIAWLAMRHQLAKRTFNKTTGVETQRNPGDTGDVATGTHSDDGTTTTLDKLT